MMRPARRNPWILLVLFAPMPFLIVFTGILVAYPRLLLATWGAYGMLLVVGALIQDHNTRKHRVRVYRTDFGLCLECGYNLRGVAGRCPECGTEIHRQPAL